jgi:hypothetical protein
MLGNLPLHQILLEKTCNDLNDPFLIIHVPRAKKPTILANGLFLLPTSLSAGGGGPELPACSAKKKSLQTIAS